MEQYISKAFKLAKDARQVHEDEISEAYKYTRPNRDIYRADTSKTDRTKIYDSTAVDGVQNLVSTILTIDITQSPKKVSYELWFNKRSITTTTRFHTFSPHHIIYNTC